MGALVTALLVANALNFALNGLFLLQFVIYVTALAASDPLFLRVVVYLFSILDVFHTATIAYIGWKAHTGFLHSRTFLSLYATIRSWNMPISVAVYGFYTFQIQGLTGSWKIPGVVILLVLSQIVGSIMWTVGTVTAKSPMDLRVGSAITMAGTLLCTLGASLCSACVMISMILIFRSNSLWRSSTRRDLLLEFQIISVRIHVPLLLVSMTDLISYLFLPRLHVSMVMAIIVGKIWSNTLLHGLNSRRGLRTTFNAPVGTTDLDTMEFAPQRRHRNSVARDILSVELTEIGGSGSGSTISSVGLEQDLSSVRLSEDEKDMGEVEDHQAIYVRFSEQPYTQRGDERRGRRSSAPV